MTLQNFYQDADATETQEWLEAFAAIVEPKVQSGLNLFYKS